MMAVDPVCGMDVKGRTKERHEYAGTTYVFCSADCKRRFVEEPDMYTGDPGMGRAANRDG
jgi:YHS domain-containing protein